MFDVFNNVCVTVIQRSVKTYPVLVVKVKVLAIYGIKRYIGVF